jgi:hypothetical protein
MEATKGAVLFLLLAVVVMVEEPVSGTHEGKNHQKS